MYCPNKPLKIGRSINTERRNKELNQKKRTTSLDSDDYVIAYDWLVNNCVEMENQIQNKLSYCRYNKKRELYILSLKEAIDIVSNLISNSQNNPELDFYADFNSKEWDSISFNLQQLIKFQIELKEDISENEIIDCLRNLIDFSQDKKEKEYVIELYKQINYRDNIHKWFNNLQNHQKQLLKSYTNRQLSNSELDSVLNLKSFDCKGKSFVTEIKPLAILKNLEILNLSHTKINDLQGIECFKNLKELHFNQTTVNSLKPLLNLASLKTIYCIGSKIEDKDIDYFFEFRKDCEIINKSFMDNDLSNQIF